MRLIDADALYKKLNDIRKEEILLHGSLNNKNCCTLSTALFEIDCAPTIELRCEDCEAFNKTRLLVQQPERKKGKWIPQDFNKHNGMVSTAVYYYPKCSVCGNSADYTNFCPNCGADMREEQDDQNK